VDNKQTQDIGDGKPGPGRPKGSVNKTTAAIKEMVIQALSDAGGIEYLVAQSRDNPTAFLTLVGKVLPLQVNAEHKGDVIAHVVFKGLNDDD
jgi:hypothetical protein